MDLGKFDVSGANKGSVLILRDPGTNEPILDENTGQPVSITCLGRDSAAYQAGRRKAANKRLSKGVTANGRITASVEELEEDGRELVVGCVKEWSHVNLDGEPLPCTPENVRALFKRCPWVYEQVDKFIEDRANFLGN